MLTRKKWFDIVKEIRKQFEVPIIIVSARTDDIDKIKGLGYGADDYLTKPFSPTELVARIKSHIIRYEKIIGKKPSSNIITNKSFRDTEQIHIKFMLEERK